jgi:hypothetical protein
MLVELAIKRAGRDLLYEQLVRFVFHASERTGRPVTLFVAELAERFHSSASSIRRRISRGVELGTLKRELRTVSGCWNDASALSIDWGQLSGGRSDSTPSHADCTPGHRDCTPSQPDWPLKEIQVYQVNQRRLTSRKSSRRAMKGADKHPRFFPLRKSKR